MVSKQELGLSDSEARARHRAAPVEGKSSRTSESSLAMHSNRSFQQIEDDVPSDSEDRLAKPKSFLKKKKAPATQSSTFMRRGSKGSGFAMPGKKQVAPKPVSPMHSPTSTTSVEVDEGNSPMSPSVPVQRTSSLVLFRRKAAERTNIQVPILEESDPDEEDDPVMAFFTARNTQKVRFCLGEVEPKERGRGATSPKSRSLSPKARVRPSGSSSATASEGKTMTSTFNIKKFMKGALFGVKGKESSDEIFERELAREMDEAQKQNKEMVWSTQEDGMPEVLRTNPDLSVQHKNANGEVISFVEDPETRATVTKLLNKARRAQFIHYRYQYAVKCYIRALELLQGYPTDHPTVVQTLKSLQQAHFAAASYSNSANIVKLGIKYEDAGELVRALKMYTIAYRIRRESLSPTHPSLVILLNMLGSIQIKRGELDEAMAIYELALKDTAPPDLPGGNNSSGGSDSTSLSSSVAAAAGIPSAMPRSTNHLARAVTCREMGTIHEQWAETAQALRMYHKSLDCMAEFKELSIAATTISGLDSYSFFHDDDETRGDDNSGASKGKYSPSTDKEILRDLEQTRLSGSSSSSTWRLRPPGRRKDVDRDSNSDEGGMELTFGESRKVKKGCKISASSEILHSPYDVFFPLSLEQKKWKKRLPVGKKAMDEKKGDFTDVDVALTIHRIAQLHRSQEEYHLALPAFNVALRGMKYALGKSHPNVAAILGNIGNLQKEMGDMDAAYATYQQVLAIESYRLGLSHPDVVVTLHNISTIDAARGNHEHALSLYTQVVSLQRKLFGEDHESVAVTSACMGDVYERLGDTKSAVECYEEALRIKIAALGRHSLEVARLLHKLGKLAVSEEDFHLAHSYISKAALVYRLNKLRDDDEWVVDVNRDGADIDAAIAMGRGGDIFEC
jgi:tetratricopeptide (TPR) repeat protein